MSEIQINDTEKNETANKAGHFDEVVGTLFQRYRLVGKKDGRTTYWKAQVRKDCITWLNIIEQNNGEVYLSGNSSSSSANKKHAIRALNLWKKQEKYVEHKMIIEYIE